MGATGHRGQGRGHHDRHQGPSARASRVHRAVPPRLRPTGVVLFATIDDGATARFVDPYQWNGDPSGNRRVPRHPAGALTRHPLGRRLHGTIAWLLGR